MTDTMENFVEKVKVLNLKRGDIIVVKYKDVNFQPDAKIPHHIWSKKMQKELDTLKKYFEPLKINILFIPDSLDLEVIRLEEWFV